MTRLASHATADNKAESAWRRINLVARNAPVMPRQNQANQQISPPIWRNMKACPDVAIRFSRPEWLRAPK
jgi:hypothetical protein